MTALDAGRVVDVVVRLVEALTLHERVRALHEVDIYSPVPDQDWTAAVRLRCAAGRELDQAESALIVLVDGADHELCLTLIHRLAAGRRAGETRAKRAYGELAGSDPAAVRHALDTERATRPAGAEVGTVNGENPCRGREHEFSGRYGLGNADLLKSVACERCGGIWDVACP